MSGTKAKPEKGPDLGAMWAKLAPKLDGVRLSVPRAFESLKGEVARLASEQADIERAIETARVDHAGAMARLTTEKETARREALAVVDARWAAVLAEKRAELGRLKTETPEKAAKIREIRGKFGFVAETIRE